MASISTLSMVKKIAEKTKGRIKHMNELTQQQIDAEMARWDKAHGEYDEREDDKPRMPRLGMSWFASTRRLIRKRQEQQNNPF